MKKLNIQQKKFLKGLAHNKKPVVTVGQHGLSETLMEELSQTLDHHELIKIKLPAGEKSVRAEMLEQICKRNNAFLVTQIGRIGVVFKAVKEPKIELPK